MKEIDDMALLPQRSPDLALPDLEPKERRLRSFRQMRTKMRKQRSRRPKIAHTVGIPLLRRRIRELVVMIPVMLKASILVELVGRVMKSPIVDRLGNGESQSLSRGGQTASAARAVGGELRWLRSAWRTSFRSIMTS